MDNFIIGTRASKLALWQAEHVKTLIQTHLGAASTLKKISTKGDEILDRSLVEIGGKGLFLKEIEDALLAGTIDLAVHSMKDVPYALPKGLTLAAILIREDVRDSFLSIKSKSLLDLPQKARVGTSSLRRSIQIKKLRPDLTILPLRGNVDTRIRKLEEGEFDAIILATAGLNRLGLTQHIKEKLNLVSAVGQGAIGIECREGDVDLVQKLATLGDPTTTRCVTLERYFIEKLGGSCQTPIGCHALEDVQDKNKFTMRCFWANPDGTNYREEAVTGQWTNGKKMIDELLS